MALKTMMLRKKLDDMKARMEELESKDSVFSEREAELEGAIEEASTEEEQALVEAEVEKFTTEKEEHEKEKSTLSAEIESVEREISEEEEAQRDKANAAKETDVRKEKVEAMEVRKKFFNLSLEETRSMLNSEPVQGFLSRVRSFKSQERAVTGAELTIPDNVLGVIREEVERRSKLISYVRLRSIRGTGRETIESGIPEGIWTEMCADLNELNISFNQVEVDGYKVGGFVAICNSTLEDSDLNLASEIVDAISGAIAKALDKAILFGKGTRMPLGIATRLAQTSQPSDWGANAPAWTDLHESNILKLDIDAQSGTGFFASLAGALSVAKPKYSGDGLVWVMNRKTHMKIKAKALAFNAAAAMVAGVNDTFPVIGGTIVEMEDDRIADNDIIGGYFGNYSLVQREGTSFARSEEVRFLRDQTVFKGTARYDGLPVAGEAFVIVNFANNNPETSQNFEIDYANTELNSLILTAANGSATGKTVVTVSGTVASSDPKLYYKAKTTTASVRTGDKLGRGYEALTSGTTQITAAAGTNIAVVELDGNDKVVSAGDVVSVPKS